MLQPGASRATIREVARQAGVSISTVSRVLNESPHVREAVRLRVREAASQLGYSPDQVARSLRTRQTAVVACLISDISNPLLAAVTRAADATLSREGYLMLVANSAARPSGDLELLELLWEHRVDGVLCAVQDETDPATREALARSPVPVVLMDRLVEGLPLDAVLADHRTGLRTATLDLARRGHRRIALLSGPVEQWTGRERLAGYREALAEAGLPEDPDLVRVISAGVETARRATAELLALAEPPTALLGGGNRISAGLVRTLAEAGSRAPDNLAIVVCGGFDLDVSRSDLAQVTWSVRTMGETAALQLLARMRGDEDGPRQVIVPTEYRPGASVGPAPGAGLPAEATRPPHANT